MNNFAQAVTLLGIGLVAIAVSAFIPQHSADAASVLKTIGTGLAASCLTLLVPTPRTILGGERSTDKPAPKEGSISGQ